MWWECSECGSRVESRERPLVCEECGIVGPIFVFRGSRVTGALKESSFAESWLLAGLRGLVPAGGAETS